MLRTILVAALAAGALAGMLVTGVQAVRLVPLILAAERYEAMGAPHADAARQAAHQSAAQPAQWAPRTSLERTFMTGLSNLLTAIGFALLLAAALALSGGASWHRGLLWGLGGYVTFVLAPSVSLPPAIPGMPEAPLEARQLWWLATVAATGLGLYLLLRVRLWYGALLGALCLVLPHLIGAPAPVAEAGSVVQAFRSAAQTTGLLFWLALGTATGFFLERLTPAPVPRA